MSELDGLHVVVTGATGGLGALVVARLVDAGATCHLPMVEDAVPDREPFTGPRIQATPRVSFADEAGVVAYFAALPALDASIHLVGGFSMSPVADTSVAELERLFSLNAVSCFLSCREAVRAMRRTGRGGRIVNVAAKPVLVPTAGMVAYAMTKSAVLSLTQSLSAEVSPEGIFVNAVAPSIIDTPANRSAMPDADYATWPKPEQIAETLLYLASPRNTLTTGAVVPVYGRAG